MSCYRELALDYGLEPEPLPFRPDKPVYRVIVAHWSQFMDTPMGAREIYSQENQVLDWHCYPITHQERKSKRV